MSKWDHLLESDANLRKLERAYKESGSDETALAFVSVARRSHHRTLAYYTALWQVGERPDKSSIREVTMLVVKAVEALSDSLSHTGVPFPQIQTILRLSLAPHNEGRGHRLLDDYDILVRRGFKTPDRVTRDDLEELYWLAMAMSNNAKGVLVKFGTAGREVTPRIGRSIDNIAKQAARLGQVVGL